MRIAFVVHGQPASAGSKRRVPVPGTGGAGYNTIPDDRKAGPWRARVAQVAGEAMAGQRMLAGALMFRAVFYRPRPKSHFNARGDLKPSAPAYPTSKPDTLKLRRAVEDALKGVVYLDDSLIVDGHDYKRYGEAFRVEVIVEEMAPAPMFVVTKQQQQALAL
jgi:Holliday junction resolvase RusA-like endonuclease